MNKLQCSACGSSNPLDANFCEGCGVKINGKPTLYVDKETFGKLKLKYEELLEQVNKSTKQANNIVSSSQFPPNFKFDNVYHQEYRGHIATENHYYRLDECHIHNFAYDLVGIEITGRYDPREITGEYLDGLVRLSSLALPNFYERTFPLRSGTQFYPIRKVQLPDHDITMRAEIKNSMALTYGVFVGINYYVVIT